MRVRCGKQVLAIFVIVVLIFAGIAAVKPPREKYRNLKVLPANISEQKLDSIMKSYNKALGEKCSFCHSPFPHMSDSLDYASEANEMKENARGMMRMTIYINKTYFPYDKDVQPEYLHVVHCKTCHRGVAYPED